MRSFVQGLWRLILLTAGLGAGTLTVAVAIYLVFVPHSNVVVPDVQGISLADALQELGKHELYGVLAREKWDENTPAGRVIAQDPQPNSRLRIKSEVGLTVSLGAGRVTVPDLLGVSRRQASLMLERLDLHLGKVSRVPKDGGVTPGHVVAQHPASGVAIGPGTSVDLAIAAAHQPRTYVAPDFRGMQLKEVFAFMEEAQLSVAKVEEVAASVPIGTVTSQYPLPGHPVEVGQSFTLSVSRRPGSPGASSS